MGQDAATGCARNFEKKEVSAKQIKDKSMQASCRHPVVFGRGPTNISYSHPVASCCVFVVHLPVYLLCIVCASAVYLVYIYCVFAAYVLRICGVIAVYLLCICYVFNVYRYLLNVPCVLAEY